MSVGYCNFNFFQICEKNEIPGKILVAITNKRFLLDLTVTYIKKKNVVINYITVKVFGACYCLMNFYQDISDYSTKVRLGSALESLDFTYIFI